MKAGGTLSRERMAAYFSVLGSIPEQVEVTDMFGVPLDISSALGNATEMMRATHDAGNKLIFIGNGGSAAIASHMAIDYTKNGRLRALAFNDGPSLTCLGNDLGYEHVFEHQISMHARPGDLLVAISSSGKSPNILAAVAAAKEQSCEVITLSGFKPDNALRRLGQINFYVARTEYGFVEVSHLVLCHAILDLAMGWGQEGSLPNGA